MAASHLPKAELLRHETQLLDMFFDDEEAPRVATVTVMRPGPDGMNRPAYRLRIRDLSGKEIDECSRKAAIEVDHPQVPKAKLQVGMNDDLARIWMILTATLPPDDEHPAPPGSDLIPGKNLWWDQAGWKKCGVIAPEHYLEKRTRPGERKMLAERILQMSGFDSELVDLASD